jgi:hypothetical protein
MDKFFCGNCASTAEPRRIHADPSGTYVVCDRCGTLTKLGPGESGDDQTSDEVVVGIREHMPRGAADTD